MRGPSRAEVLMPVPGTDVDQEEKNKSTMNH